MKRFLLLMLCALEVAATRSSAEDIRYPSTVSDGVRTFDGVNVLLQRKSVSYDERQAVKEMFRLFACGVYEATEGEHRIGTVSIRITDKDYTESEMPGIVWLEDLRKAVLLNGNSNQPKEKSRGFAYPAPKDPADASRALIGQGGPIYLAHTDQNGADFFQGGSSTLASGGATLAHEWGHAAYGFGDEYVESGKFAAAVEHSLMGSYTPTDWSTFNFSIPETNPNTFYNGSWHRWYKHAPKTGQDGRWSKSCWETLVDSDSDCFASFRSGGKLRSNFTPAVQIPSSSSSATAVFRVVWLDDPLLGICVDCSGSMATSDRMEKAIQQLKAKVETIPDGTWTSVRGFDSTSFSVVPFTKINDAADGGMTRQYVENQIGSLYPGGGTAIWDALDSMIDDIVAKREELGSDVWHPASIWFVTDGEDLESRTTRAAVEARARASENGIVIHSVGFGTGANSEELKQIAQNTGGTFHLAGDSVLDLAEADTRSGSTAPGRVNLVDSRITVGPSGSVSHGVQIDSSVRKLFYSIGVQGVTSVPKIVMINPRTGATTTPTLSTFSSGSGMVTFRIDDPAPGNWIVKATSVTPGATLTLQAQGTPTFETPRLSVYNSGLYAYARLSYSVPVDGADVSAVSVNGNSRRNVSFTGIGNGLYRLYLPDCGDIDGGLIVTAVATAGKATLLMEGVNIPGLPIRSSQKLSETFSRAAFLDIAYKPKFGTVVFDANGGTGKMASQKQVAGVDFMLRKNAFTRKNYRFLGWSRSKDGGIAFLDQARIRFTTAPTTVTLYAVWEQTHCVVTFKPNGGKCSTKSRTVKRFESLGYLPYPSRKGYAFDGWRTKKKGGAIQLSVSPVAQSMVLYANWTKKKNRVAVGFSANGGKVNGRSSATRLYTAGRKFGTLPRPTRKGYKFLGWYQSSAGKGPKLTPARIVPTVNGTYGFGVWVAKWKGLPVRVSFRANGGKVSVRSRKYTNGKTYSKLPTPTRKGYLFDGWYTKKKGGKKITAQKTATPARTVLYAHWTKSVVVSFDANGGTVSPAKKTYRIGRKYGPLPTPTRNGWLFEGWYTKASGGTRVSDSSKAGAKVRNLHAHWTNKVIVRFYGNGGTVSSPDCRTYVYRGTYGSLPTATRTGYSFDGWWTSSYLSSATRISESTVVTATESFYARWAPPVTISFDGNGGTPDVPSRIFVAIYETPSLHESEFRLDVADDWPSASRSGRSFAGWYTKPEGGDRIGPVDGDVYYWWNSIRDNWSKYHSLPPAKTVYAHWTDSSADGEASPTSGRNPSRTEPSSSRKLAAAVSLLGNLSVDSLGDTPWTEAEFGGELCADSGAIGDGGMSVLRAEVEGSGTLAFRWMASSEQGKDIVFFSVDGQDVASRSGPDEDWTTVSLRVEGDGPHVLSWTYAKDASGSAGDDRARLSDVVWLAD